MTRSSLWGGNISFPPSRNITSPTVVPSDRPATRSWRDRVISTRHAEIAIRQTDGGKLPILFLHGGGLCKEIFQRQIESGLGAQYAMIAIDFPGHGASGDAFEPERTYGLEGLADAALEVLEQLGIDRAVVVGASCGARVALRLADVFPGLAGLALTGLSQGAVDPTAPIDLDARRALASLDDAPFATAIARVDPRALDLVARDLASDATPDWTNELEIPTMFVDGAGKRSSPDREATRASRRFAVPKAGPAPYLEVPTVYNHLLQRFLRSVERRERSIRAAPQLWWGG